jgi:hypothetical protein
MYCHVCRGFAWLKNGVLNLMTLFIEPLYNRLQQFTNHYLTGHWHLLLPDTISPSELDSRFNLTRLSLHYDSLPVYLILRPTVSRPVFLGIKPRSGAYDQIFITFTQFRVCWYGAPSLTRGRICLLQCTMYNIQYILLSQIWEQVPLFISPRNRVARLYPHALGLTHCDPSLCI